MTQPGGVGWRRNEVEYWKKAGGGWQRWEAELLYSLAAVDPVLFRALDVRSGQRILDAGCGLGEPSLALASLVGPKGSVLGVDLSADMLAAARRRARSRQARNARFRRVDLNRFRWQGRPFHRVVSRYGVMFVDDPEDLLRRLRDALLPGGRAAFAIWGDPKKNPFFLLRCAAVSPFMQKQEVDIEDTPGPMRFWRPGRFMALMRRAGFQGVQEEDVSVAIVHRDPETSVRQILDTSMAELWQGLGRSDRIRLKQRLLRGIRPFWDGGAVRYPGRARVVSGRRGSRPQSSG